MMTDRRRPAFNQTFGSASKWDTALKRRRCLELFRKATLGEGHNRGQFDPAQPEIPKRFKLFSSDFCGSRFGPTTRVTIYTKYFA